MSKKSGFIELYSGGYDFIDRRKYRYISDRDDIIEKWKKLYALENKLYFLIIKPDYYVENKSKYDEGMGKLQEIR